MFIREHHTCQILTITVEVAAAVAVVVEVLDLAVGQAVAIVGVVVEVLDLAVICESGGRIVTMLQWSSDRGLAKGERKSIRL